MSAYIKELEEKVKYLQEQSDLYSGALYYTIGRLGALHDKGVVEPKTIDEMKDTLEIEFKGLNLRR